MMLCTPRAAKGSSLGAAVGQGGLYASLRELGTVDPGPGSAVAGVLRM